MNQRWLSCFNKAVIILPLFILSIAISANGQETGNIQGNVVGYGNRHAPNTLIFIEDLTGDFEPPKEYAVMDLINSEFVPSMLPILKGTTIDFRNSDAGWHNVYSPEQSVTPFNLGTYPPGYGRSMTFNRIGVVPVSDFMHSEMKTYIIVLGNPFFDVTDKEGNYKINDVPTGTYSLRVWHKDWFAETQKITVKSGETSIVDYTLE